MRKNAFEQDGKSVSYFESKRMLPIWKEMKQELKTVHSQVLQDVVLRVNLAFRASSNGFNLAKKKLVILASRERTDTIASVILRVAST